MYILIHKIYLTHTHTHTHYRQYGAIPALIGQLRNEDTKVVMPVLGALRNLSFGRINDENKLMIVREQGLEELMVALKIARVMEVSWLECINLARTFLCVCVFILRVMAYIHTCSTGREKHAVWGGGVQWGTCSMGRGCAVGHMQYGEGVCSGAHAVWGEGV